MRSLMMFVCWTAVWAAVGAPAEPATRAGETPSGEQMSASAFTAPSEDLEIASAVAGVVAKVRVAEGQRVDTPGQVLVELNADVLRADLAVTEARVKAADVEISAGEASYKTRQRLCEDLRKLVEQKVVPELELIKAELEVELARFDVERAKEQKKVLELAAARDREAVNQTLIRAPVAGEVHRILRHPGESVGQNQPVLRLIAVDPLYVVAYVPTRATERLTAGMAAALRLEDRPAVALACTVLVVDRAADAASGTCRVKLTLPNPERKVAAGSKGTLTFTVPR